MLRQILTYPTPVLLGTGYTVICTNDCVVDYLAFSNTDASNRTVTVKNGVGGIFIPLVTVQAGDLMTIPIPEGGLRFHGGMSALASTGAVVWCWVRVLPTC